MIGASTTRGASEYEEGPSRMAATEQAKPWNDRCVAVNIGGN
jgi:hypothetical protein